MGRVVEAETDNCLNWPPITITDEWFSYSPRGELTDVYEYTPHSGGYYHTTASYWASGAVDAVSGIPSVPTLYYGASNNSGVGLDGEGRYTQVTAGSGQNPVTNVAYSTTTSPNPLRALTGVTYGSSDSDSFGYDPNTGRPTGYVFNVNGATDSGSLSWNTNGTLASLNINDDIPGTNDSESCSLNYDDLGRVGGQDANGYSLDCGSKWQQLFSYDAFGNIDKSGSSAFQASYSSATNQFGLSGVNVQYDADGNLLSDNLNSYAWDAFGDLASVNGITATYDALGRVVEQSGGSGYAEILYSPIGKVAILSGSTLTKAFLVLPGAGTVVYGSSGVTYYRHADWLGSSRLASTQSRTLYSSAAYAPFGETYATSGTADPSFIGQNSDTVSSLYDFTFRRLSPSQGRWISPDPFGLGAVDPSNPQTWNSYVYVQNNPLSLIDPLGLDDSGCTWDTNTNTLFCPVEACTWEPSTSTLNCPGETVPGCVAEGTEGCILPPSPGSSGGGGGVDVIIVADNGPSYSHQDVCAASALLHKGADAALDLLGTVPELGNMSEGVKATIDGLQLAGGVLSAAMTVFGDDPIAAASSGAGLGLAAAGKTFDKTAVLSATTITKISEPAVRLFGDSIGTIPLFGNLFSLTNLVLSDIPAIGNYYNDCLQDAPNQF
jgi:RHS repeat-associated protein